MTKSLKKHHHYNKQKRKHLGLKISLAVFLTIIIAIAAIAFGIYKNIEATFANAYIKGHSIAAVDFSKSKPFTTLILETGTTANKNNCFATVLASSNPKIKQTTFLNFPVTATLPDQTTMTETYTKGGEEAVLESVKRNLNIPVNKIVKIDINKIGEIVEATGGITLQNPKAFIASGYQFNQGSIYLSTADQVSSYLTLVNDEDQEALVTRIQDVSMAIYNNIQEMARAKKILRLNDYRSILNAFSDTVKTDISFNEFKKMALNYNSALHTTSKLNLHTTSDSGKEVVSSDELNKIKQLFNDSLK